MSSRFGALAAGIAVLSSNMAWAEPVRNSALQPVAYHVQLARTSLPTQVAQRATPAAEALPESVKGSLGCLMAGSAGTTLAALAGGEEIINVVAGGGLPPTNRLVYMTGLLTVVFVSFCAVGQTMTPLYSHLMGEEEPAPHEPIQINRSSRRHMHEVSLRVEQPGAQTSAPSFRASLRQSIAATGR